VCERERESESESVGVQQVTSACKTFKRARLKCQRHSRTPRRSMPCTCLLYSRAHENSKRQSLNARRHVTHPIHVTCPTCHIITHMSHHHTRHIITHMSHHHTCHIITHMSHHHTRHIITHMSHHHTRHIITHMSHHHTHTACHTPYTTCDMHLVQSKTTRAT